MNAKEINFSQVQKFTRVKDLGSGACGYTILMHDDILQTDFGLMNIGAKRYYKHKKWSQK